MTEMVVEEEIYQKASELIRDSINKILIKKDKVILGLPGGKSISPILESLKYESLRWEKIHVFMVDERFVPIDDEDSNFRLIKQNLFDVIPQNNLHPFIYENDNFGLESYKKEISNFGEKYDIIVVSSGEDGHIASLFPDHPSILDESNIYIFVDQSPKPPLKRMSISKNMVLKSSVGIVLFNGETKKDAYLKFLDKNVDYVRCPAKLISELPKSYVLTNIRLNARGI